MDPVLISFSFLAGLQAFFAPCSIGLIPAYVGYYVKQDLREDNKRTAQAIGRKVGIDRVLAGVLPDQIVYEKHY